MEKKHLLTISVGFLAVLAIGGAALLQKERERAERDASASLAETLDMQMAARLYADTPMEPPATAISEVAATTAPFTEATTLPPETTVETTAVTTAATTTAAITAPPATNPPAPVTKAPMQTAAPAVTQAATTVTEAAPASSTGEPSSDYAKAVFDLVNQERAKAGIAALTYDSAVAACADIRAVEIEQNFSHTRPDGRKPFTVFSDNGVANRWSAENIAYGQRSAEEVMTDWMSSKGHRENILNPNLTNIGIGVYQKGNTLYWVQMFRTP